MKYRLGYLSNGSKVKISDELFNRLKQWEEKNIVIADSFLDELKMQDNNWINKNRSYYRKNTSYDCLKSMGIEFVSKYNQSSKIYELSAGNLLSIVFEVLIHCTELQRQRFIKHFFYGMSYHAIAKQERKNKDTVRDSVKKVVKMLRNYE